VRTVIAYFRGDDGKHIQKTLNFRRIYHQEGYLREPVAEMAQYALEFALKDPRLHKWVRPRRQKRVKT
jgi:hypothetical protein